ncbi:hypothetical protein ES703_29926 [subsurface metagenome]
MCFDGASDYVDGVCAVVWLIEMKKVEIEIPESCDTCGSNNFRIIGTMKDGVLDMRVSCMICKLPHNFEPIITEHERSSLGG